MYGLLGIATLAELAEEHVRAPPPDLATLLGAPDDEVSRLAAFAGLTPAPDRLDAARPLLDRTRRGLAARPAPARARGVARGV